ncbi:MAG: AraC family transcriptional regulator, partial [Melioribacteraceae bacterium]
TIRELAENLNIHPNHLSQIINEKLGQNFFDFINSYRIKEAEKLLLKNGKKTILEIAFEVGFNSKSTFNAAFKKHTGVTPTAYKNLKKETV